MTERDAKDLALERCRRVFQTQLMVDHPPANIRASIEDVLVVIAGAMKGAPPDDTKAVVDEQVRWQARLNALARSIYAKADGAGTESGDPLDFTEAELKQAFAHLQDRVAELRDELLAAAGRFQLYANNHKASGKTEKAAENRQWSDRCWTVATGGESGKRYVDLETLRRFGGCSAVAKDRLHCELRHGHKGNHETHQGALISWPDHERDPKLSEERERQIVEGLMKGHSWAPHHCPAFDDD